MRYIFCYNLRLCSLKVPKWWILSFHEQMTIIEVVIHRSLLNIFFIIELSSCSIQLSILYHVQFKFRHYSKLLNTSYFDDRNLFKIYRNTIYIRHVWFSFFVCEYYKHVQRADFYFSQNVCNPAAAHVYNTCA